MINLQTEIDYYQKRPKQLRTNKKHLIALYGADQYKELVKKCVTSPLVSERKYRDQVRRLTEKQPLHTLQGIEGRAFNGLHIDHVISIKSAYRMGWTPEQCADISNLQILTNAENVSKRHKCFCKWPKT